MSMTAAEAQANEDLQAIDELRDHAARVVKRLVDRHGDFEVRTLLHEAERLADAARTRQWVCLVNVQGRAET